MFTITFTIHLLVQVHLSFRGAAAVCQLLWDHTGGLVGLPSFATVRQWLLRWGLYLLRRPVAVRDWLVILDHTIQLGQRKCLLVLGLPLAAVQATGFAFGHADVTVLALEVLAHSTWEGVLAVLRRVQTQIGRIGQILSDHGSDLRKGSQAFQAEQPGALATYDIRHLLACLLKAALQADPVWAEFLQHCTTTRARLQQTAGRFLSPPVLRTKARYMNVETHVTWAWQVLEWAAAADWAALGTLLGRTASAAEAWFAEHLGWLQGLQESLQDYAGLLRVVATAEDEVQRAGMSKQTATRFWERWQAVAETHRWRVWQFAQGVYERLAAEGEHVPAGQSVAGSSLVIESVFAKYKEVARHNPSGEIGPSVLVLPAMTTALSNALLQEALETVSWSEVEAWVKENVGESPAARKRRLFGTNTKAFVGELYEELGVHDGPKAA